MEAIAEYDELNDNIKTQLDILYPIYCKNSIVQRKLITLKRGKHLNKENKKKLINYAIFLSFDTRHFMQHNYKLLNCYTNKHNGQTIKITKILTTHKHTVVLIGKYKDKEVIIKYYKSDKKDTMYEIGIYKKLKKMGCELPWYSSKFMFMGSRVLVMEKLEKINSNDSIYSIGKAVVNQLSYLHQFGIHNDIKPDNIMKKKVNETYKYFLIDYGGIATEKLKYGYCRWIWTASWTCQPKGQHDQVSTPKNDFIELAYTLNYIHNKCNKDNFKHICHDCLGKYYKHVSKLGTQNYNTINYDQICGFLQN